MLEDDEKALNEYFSGTFRAAILSEDEKRAKKEILRKSLSEDLTSPGVFCRWLKDACEHRDGEELDNILLLGWTFELFDEETVTILEQISLENWVKTNNLEDMVGLIERCGGPENVKILASMAVQKYPGHYLGEDDEHITRKAMWALHRLYKDKGKEDALEKIKELSKCGDSIAEGFAKHHLEKLGAE